MKISNWNNQPKIADTRSYTFPEVPGSEKSVCVRGLGRSYGDASLDRSMVDMCGHLSVFEWQEDVLEVSSGFSLGEVLNRIVPKGYTLPVIPGTQHVTVGGMIAADVHGKNHALNGSIGSWIERIHLRLADGRELYCSPQAYPDLFRATIGGLGLTGIILSACLKLERIEGSQWTQRNIRFYGLNELIDGLLRSKAGFKVAWFDARSRNRFFLLESEIQRNPEALSGFKLKKPGMKIPRIPFSVISNALMRVYNRNYARKLGKQPERSISWDECFFPLDGIGNWNRLYGPRGFYQLQCVLPLENAVKGYQALLEKMRQAGRFPVLSVMKLHGDHPIPGMLSYTHPGISVAFDFINTSGTAAFIRELYQFIADQGGRVYLVKDALLLPEQFEKMYPEVEEFRKVVMEYNSGQINSLLAKRLNLVRL